MLKFGVSWWLSEIIGVRTESRRIFVAYLNYLLKAGLAAHTRQESRAVSSIHKRLIGESKIWNCDLNNWSGT